MKQGSARAVALDLSASGFPLGHLAAAASVSQVQTPVRLNPVAWAFNCAGHTKINGSFRDVVT